jgi:1-acyl-sn-glycerol-3-phosphate acyltransferase
MIYWLMRALFTLFFRFWGGWEVTGHEHVPREGAVLIAPNHLSFLDPPLMGCALQRPGWFMAKAELFDVPGFRWLITHMHAYPVKRGAPDRAALKRTLDYLRNGEVVCVFPEGKRSVDGQLSPIESGIGMLAVKTGAPIVPVAIRGTDHVLPRDAKRLYRARVRVRFGLPIPVPPAEGRTDKELSQVMADQLRDRIQALMDELDGKPSPPPALSTPPLAPLPGGEP